MTRRPLRVLLAILRHDYGVPDRGNSYEYIHFHGALAAMEGVDVRLLDYGTAHARGGREAVSAELLEAIAGFAPDIVLTLLHEDEFEPEVLMELRGPGAPATVAWFADDHWRFDDFSRRWAPCFDVAVTTSRDAVPRYERLGTVRVVRSQWAVNHHVYRPGRTDPAVEVSFIGMAHGARPEVIGRLRAQGIPVQTWGHGWSAGRLDDAGVVDVLSRSQVSINLSNSSGGSRRQRLARLLRGRRDTPQIKGRNFEIPACGTLQLSEPAEDLEAYYEPGREIVIASGVDAMAEETRRYLADARARRAIAEAGLRRTLAEHTYERRFRELFTEIGLPVP